MTPKPTYTAAERDEAVKMYVTLVNSGMSRSAAGELVHEQLGPRRTTVANWVRASKALLPPTWQDVQSLRETKAALKAQVRELSEENAHLRAQLASKKQA